MIRGPAVKGVKVPLRAAAAQKRTVDWIVDRVVFGRPRGGGDGGRDLAGEHDDHPDQRSSREWSANASAAPGSGIPSRTAAWSPPVSSRSWALTMSSTSSRSATTSAWARFAARRSACRSAAERASSCSSSRRRGDGGGPAGTSSATSSATCHITGPRPAPEAHACLGQQWCGGVVGPPTTVWTRLRRGRASRTSERAIDLLFELGAPALAATVLPPDLVRCRHPPLSRGHEKHPRTPGTSRSGRQRSALPAAPGAAGRRSRPRSSPVTAASTSSRVRSSDLRSRWVAGCQGAGSRRRSRASARRPGTPVG